MFRVIDLSRTIPLNTVAITFRYQITGETDADLPSAWLSDNHTGENPIPLVGASGQLTVRLRTAQKLYYDLKFPGLHLDLRIIDYRALEKHSC
mgnify:CR=1 FL=1